MIVLTLTKVPNSLRGDLTKWYQEIQTGVYVGNVSARVRELVWERVVSNIGNGEATMVYNAKNEVGYQFKTTRKDKEVVDFDGIPLMMHKKHAASTIEPGFSDMAKFHKAKIMSRKMDIKSKANDSGSFVSIDLETTGLEVNSDQIISIGAVKNGPSDNQNFYKLIHIENEIPKVITKLTGITTQLVHEQGIPLVEALQELKKFVGSEAIVGYNIRFDEQFLTAGFNQIGEDGLTNLVVDLMPKVKKDNPFLPNYRLETVLQEYNINNSNQHNALADAGATMELASKLMKKGLLHFKK